MNNAYLRAALNQAREAAARGVVNAVHANARKPVGHLRQRGGEPFHGGAVAGVVVAGRVPEILYGQAGGVRTKPPQFVEGLPGRKRRSGHPMRRDAERRRQM